MRKLTKLVIASFAFSSLIFASVGPVVADQTNKPGTSISVKSGEKASKNKSTKAKKAKKTKKAKKAKKAAKLGKAKKIASNKKRVANFAPAVEPTPDHRLPIERKAEA